MTPSEPTDDEMRAGEAQLEADEANGWGDQPGVTEGIAPLEAEHSSVEWRLSFYVWPHGESPRTVERVTHDEHDAREQWHGLLSMVAPHEKRPCGDHVWDVRLQKRVGNVRRFVVRICPGCGWVADKGQSWCCSHPQCRVPDAHGLRDDSTIALMCIPVDTVAIEDLPDGAVPQVLWEDVDV